MEGSTNQQLSASGGVRDPNKNDVLCGRGSSINSHAGNSKFRELVKKHRTVYLNARFKQEKRLIATTIVSEIRSMDPSGRFLAKDAATGLWCDIGDEKARDKTSQALRENAPSLRAGINGVEKKPRTKPKRKANDSAAAVHAPAAQPAFSTVASGQAYNGYYAQQPVLSAQLQSQQQPPKQYGTVRAYPNQHAHLGTGPYHFASTPTGSASTWQAQGLGSQAQIPIQPEAHPSSAVSTQESRHYCEANAPNYMQFNQQQQIHSQTATPINPNVVRSSDNISLSQQQDDFNQTSKTNQAQRYLGEKPSRHHPTGGSSHSTTSLQQNQEVMDIENESNQNSSMLTMVANHILGAWDTDALCGIDSDFTNTKRTAGSPKRTNQEYNSMPPPKHRGKDEVDLSCRTSSFNNKWSPEKLQNSSILTPAGSFVSEGISPTVSMDVDENIVPKEWRTEMDATSLGSLSSGLISMNENVLNQMPSWEGSLHSMSAASIKPKDSNSFAVAPSRARPDESHAGSEVSFDTFMSQDYVDSRMAIALQQQENVAAYEAFKKRHEASVKASANRTARSSALDRLKPAGDRNEEMSNGNMGENDNGIFSVGNYVPPLGTALPQEVADHRLAMELQRFEQARAGTIRRMEKILKEGRDGQKKSGLRTGRSVYQM